MKLLNVTLALSLLLTMFLLVSPINGSINQVNASITEALVNPLDGTNNFNFTNLRVGDTLDINVTVSNVQNLGGWRAYIYWDPAILEYARFVLPSDNVFAYSASANDPLLLMLNTWGTGAIDCGTSLGSKATKGFTGSGTLGVLTLGVIKAVNSSEPPVSCRLGEIYSNTWLIDQNGQFMDFALGSGLYSLSYGVPLPSDVLRDGVVNMKDIATAVLAYYSLPNTTRWNPYADVNNDSRIDMRDIALIVFDFGKHGPSVPSGEIPAIEKLLIWNLYSENVTNGWIAHVVMNNTGPTNATIDSSKIWFFSGTTPPQYAPIMNFSQVMLAPNDTFDMQFLLLSGNGSPWHSQTYFVFEFVTEAGYWYSNGYYPIILY